MVRKIHLFIEGGGDGRNTRALIQTGFSAFFQSLVQTARSKKIRWDVTMCGSRESTFRYFKNALKANPDAFNVLLVDAEAPVNTTPWLHLKHRDNWDKPPAADDSQCHLMVQTMEAWLLADVETLKKFYGKGFQEHAIPKLTNVENISKNQLESSLKLATRDTSKGEYHKIQHAAKLLTLLAVDKVRKAAPHCERLFRTLSKKVEEG